METNTEGAEVPENITDYKNLFDLWLATKKQNAALKKALADLLPIAERMQATCEDGGSKSYDNEWDAADAIEYKAVIEHAKKLLNKTE